MTVLEISVDRAGQPGLYDVEIIQSPVGEVSATVPIDCDHLMQGRDQWQQALLASTASTRRVVAGPETAIQAVGQVLYEALLGHPELASRYRSSLDVAAERGEPLRLVLRLSAPELTPLPWEAMYDPVTGTYVSRSEPLVRHVPVASAPRPLRVEHPVRILGIIASPQGLPALDVEAEEQYLTQALSEPIRQGRIDLHWIRHATWQRIQDTLLSDQWHVVHFIGHGDFDTLADEGVLVLEGEDGRVSLVEASRFADLLHEARPMPRLVVLNSCLSALSGSADLFSGTASALVRGGVSAVVAMQFEITDPAAAAFARGFYSAVAAGRPVDQAVRSGRVAILGMNGHTLEWITPVLYVRGQETRLFSLRKPRKPAATAEASAKEEKDTAESVMSAPPPPALEVLSTPMDSTPSFPSVSEPESASDSEDDFEPWYEEFPESSIPTVPAVTRYTLDEFDLNDDGEARQPSYDRYSFEPDDFLDSEPAQFAEAQAPISSAAGSSPATEQDRSRRLWIWLVPLLVLLLIAGLLWLFLLWRPEPIPEESPVGVPNPSPETTSAGPMDTTVPVLASQYEGRPVGEVEQELTDLGFVILRQSEPSDQPLGTVLSLNPIGQLEPGTTIFVVSSAGNAPTGPIVNAPEYEGRPLDEVVQELSAKGLSVQREPQQSDEQEGTVLSLNPVGQVALGTTITVVYSTGPVIVLPTDLVGQPADPFIERMVQSGVNINRYEEPTAGAETGTILRTDPVGGSTVGPGDTVDVWVAVEATASPSPAGED